MGVDFACLSVHHHDLISEHKLPLLLTALAGSQRYVIPNHILLEMVLDNYDLLKQRDEKY